VGFFAIVEPLSGPAQNQASKQNFEVEQLDINFWLLPLLAGRHVAYCDIGIRIKATSAVHSFDVALPFQTQDGALVDLSHTLANPDIASLVFGESVIDSSGKVIDPESNYALRVNIDTTQSKRNSNQSTDSFSLWRIELVEEIQAEGRAYVRIRFEASSFDGMLVWRRSQWRRVGALIDLHINDLREVARIPNGARYQKTIRPIDRLNVFIVVEASLQLRNSSPELRYSRLLEGELWEQYLYRATGLVGRRRFLVHFWRNTKPVTVVDEFRAFLDLGRHTQPLGLATLFTLSAVTALLVSLANEHHSYQGSQLDRALRWIGSSLASFAAEQLEVTIQSGIVAIFAAAATLAVAYTPIRRWILKTARQLEHAIFRRSQPR
jgi:hypothetical protein